MYYFKKNDGTGYLVSNSKKTREGYTQITKSQYENRNVKPTPAPIVHRTPSAEEIARRSTLREIAKCKQTLAKTDYVALKLAEALAAGTAESVLTEYASVFEERRAARSRINELEQSL